MLYDIPELLFRPPGEDVGAATMIVNAVNAAEPGSAGTMKGELLRNIFLAGGSTMFTGMEARIAAEVKGGCSVGQAGDVQVRRKRDTCVCDAWV